MSYAFASLATAVASSLWLHAFADACERARADRERGPNGEKPPHPGAGGDWADIVPPHVPRRYVVLAVNALAKVPEHVLHAGMSSWCAATGRDDERFAHVTACVLLGAGVSYHDDMPTCYYGGNARTATMEATAQQVKRLNRALPRIGEACDMLAVYDPATGNVD